MGPRAQVPARSAERRRLRELPAAVRVVTSRQLLVLAVVARFETPEVADRCGNLRRGPGGAGPVVDVRSVQGRGDAATRARLLLAVHITFCGPRAGVSTKLRGTDDENHAGTSPSGRFAPSTTRAETHTYWNYRPRSSLCALRAMSLPVCRSHVFHAGFWFNLRRRVRLERADFGLF